VFANYIVQCRQIVSWRVLARSNSGKRILVQVRKNTVTVTAVCTWERAFQHEPMTHFFAPVRSTAAAARPAQAGAGGNAHCDPPVIPYVSEAFAARGEPVSSGARGEGSPCPPEFAYEVGSGILRRVRGLGVGRLGLRLRARSGFGASGRRVGAGVAAGLSPAGPNWPGMAFATASEESQLYSVSLSSLWKPIFTLSPAPLCDRLFAMSSIPCRRTWLSRRISR